MTPKFSAGDVIIRSLSEDRQKTIIRSEGKYYVFIDNRRTTPSRLGISYIDSVYKLKHLTKLEKALK